MTTPALTLRGARLDRGGRTLWSGLDLDIAPGEFVAVLGPNGTGKTSLLRAILGEVPLAAGRLEVLGRDVRRGDARVGYIPQQKLLAEGTPLRARDLVTLGVTGANWGPPIPSARVRARVDALLEQVGATAYARVPVAQLSGGEQQRLRVAQAIADDPGLLLCDEPLLSLDLTHQRGVSELIAGERERTGAAVMFVTHDVNPVLPFVDRVLYLAGGTFRIGTPQEVLRSDVLSELYGSPIDVVQSQGRIIVVGGTEHDPHHHDEPTRDAGGAL